MNIGEDHAIGKSPNIAFDMLRQTTWETWIAGGLLGQVGGHEVQITSRQKFAESQPAEDREFALAQLPAEAASECGESPSKVLWEGVD